MSSIVNIGWNTIRRSRKEVLRGYLYFGWRVHLGLCLHPIKHDDNAENLKKNKATLGVLFRHTTNRRERQ